MMWNPAHVFYVATAFEGVAMVIRIVFLALLALLVVGCAGTESFGRYARAGDTVSLAVGLRQNLSKSNITVEITPVATGVPIIYGPGHPAIRAVFNLYPDPLSSVVVSPMVGEDLTPYAQFYASLVESNFTGPDGDWSQTVVFLDLPADMPVGRAQIQVSGAGYADPPASVVQIIDGAGFPAAFSTEGGSLTVNQLDALQRVGNHVVSFSGPTVPHAIQVDLRHDPDRDSGGIGKAHVVNTRGDIKNVAWRSDGMNLRVILTPASAGSLSDLADFKFYIAGGIEGLYVVEARAYDASGNVVPGVFAAVSAGQ